MEHRPFRFGVVAATARSGADWAETARRVEALGYSTLLVPDALEYASFAPLLALTAAAAATRTLRVGPYVLANDYRHPVLLAKEVATLDLLSEGRVELGLGAGRPSAAADYQMLGRPFEAGGVRVARLAASVALLKRLLAGETVSAQDPFYTVEQARIAPTPVQQPLPLLIAGSGPRLLGLAAREADIVALGVAPQETEAALAEKMGGLRAAAGERFAQLELTINLVGVGGQLARYVAAQAGAEAAALARSQAVTVLAGSADEMCATLLARREQLGLSYLTVPEELLENLAPIVARLAGR